MPIYLGSNKIIRSKWLQSNGQCSLERFANNYNKQWNTDYCTA